MKQRSDSFCKRQAEKVNSFNHTRNLQNHWIQQRHDHFYHILLHIQNNTTKQQIPCQKYYAYCDCLHALMIVCWHAYFMAICMGGANHIYLCQGIILGVNSYGCIFYLYKMEQLI